MKNFCNLNSLLLVAQGTDDHSNFKYIQIERGNTCRKVFKLLFVLTTPTAAREGVDRGLKALPMVATPARARTAAGEIFMVV